MGSATQVVAGVCMAASLVACGARFYVRVIKARQRKAVEWMVVSALVFNLALGSVQIQMIGLVPYIDDLDVYVVVQKLFFVGTFMYLAALWSVKISISLLHIELTRRLQRVHHFAKYTLYFLIASWPILYVIFLFGCYPEARRWTPSTNPSELCPPIVEAWDFWTHFAIHLATDIILFILPFPALLKVSERRLRIAVCGVYGLAIVALILALTRVILLAVDAQHNLDKIVILTILETTVCIVIATLPAMSSTFTRKYAYGGASSSSKQRAGTGATSRVATGATWTTRDRSDFHKFDDLTGASGDKGDGLHPATGPVKVFAEGYPSSTTGSTEEILSGSNAIQRTMDIELVVHDGKLDGIYSAQRHWA